MSATELQSVSGADATGKDHFVIVDAVGVCESDKTDSRPLERKPSVPLAALLDSVALGTRDDDTLSSLASRLARLDRVISAGFDASSTEKSKTLITSFRDSSETHRETIEALQILYSRPSRQRLTESTLEDLEAKLMRERAEWTEDRLWAAFQATMPEKVRGKSQVGRFADLVTLVRFSLEQQPILKPFAESVRERFDEWLTTKAATGAVFTADQLAWLNLIRGHIATSLSIEPDDFEYAPFSQQGGLGRAHQVFGESLPAILDELNEVLAA